jgi:hypothetical protein
MCYVGLAFTATDKEPPLCQQQPAWRYLQQSQPRGAPYSGVHGMGIGWRSIPDCSVWRAATPRRWPRSCFAPVPGWTGSGGRSVPGTSASVAPQLVHARSRASPGFSCLGSGAPWGPDSKASRGRMAGAARAGVGPLWRPRFRRNTAWRAQRKPCAAGATSWAGGGNAPNSWRQRLRRPEASGGPACGCLTSLGRPMRAWPLPMHSLALACPSWERRGGRQGRRTRV